MANKGKAVMGTGLASGENRARHAAEQALHSPLLNDNRIDGARGILINVVGGVTMGMQEVDEASTFIKEHGHKDSEIIWGAAINPDFEDQMMITVIATGFDENDEASEKKSVAGFPAMPFDALAETKDHSNSENDESNPESEIIPDDKSEVVTNSNLVADNYDYNSQNTEDEDNIHEPDETENSGYDEIIQPVEDGNFILSDNEGVDGQFSDDHAVKEEIAVEEANEMNSEPSENTFVQMNQQNLENSDSSESETSFDEKIDHKDLNSNVENDSIFEDLHPEMTSANLIDAETYSIHDSALGSNELNGKTITGESSLSYPDFLSEKDSEMDANEVETSPLIPEWANQTDNPAFFQNLDIPTFLRRRGSSRPRQ